MLPRNKYLEELIRKQWNGQVKVITGIHRCGKSVLLFDLFYEYLLASGVPAENIIALALDDDDNEPYRDPETLSAYIKERTSESKEKYFVLLDEIQFAIRREELMNKDEPVKLYSILNGLLHKKNIDVYVTGSNSKMLSKDVLTEFRGRGDVVHVRPLSFREFYEAGNMEKNDAYEEYAMYGGMPRLLSLNTDEEKYQYLESLFEEIYFKDIEERYPIQLPGVLRGMTNSLCSSVGSLTNSSKIARTVKSTNQLDVSTETISTYLGYLEDSFLFEEAVRYDVKGKKYFSYPSKFYCTDVGLRNVRLELRQQEPTHIMENIIFNELRLRGYAVDVGVVPIVEVNAQKERHKKNTEIDFIARKGGRIYYIQSAYAMEDPQKEYAELRPLLSVRDSFKKIVVSRMGGKPWMDDDGILHMNLIDFLLDENSLDK